MVTGFGAVFCLLLVITPASSLSSSVSAATVAMSASKAVIALNVRFQVKPKFRESFLKAIHDDATQTINTEPGSLQFVVGQDTQDPNKFHLHEQYKSLKDVDFHEAAPHFKAFVHFLETEDPLVVPLEVSKYQVSTTCYTSQVVSPLPAVFCLNVESCIRPQIRDDFLALMTSHRAKSFAEPGCLQFDWGESVDDPTTFYIHEQYQDKAAFDAHEQSAHFETFVAFNAAHAPYTKPQVVDFFQTPVTSS